MAASSSHGLMDPALQGIHVPYQWSYATSAARVAAAGFIATDVGKLARQTSDNSIWMLTAVTPTWVPLGPSPTNDGWILYDAVTWIYASADAPTYTFTVAGVDLTGVLVVGTKLKLTDSTVQYFIVTAITFGGGNTTVTIYGGTDYTLSGGAISAQYYSREKTPVGFPASPAKWTVTATNTSNQAQATPVSGTWYNLGSITITFPIGVWLVTWQAVMNSTSTAAQTASSESGTLSTANNSESDVEFSAFIILGTASSTAQIAGEAYRRKTLTLAAKTQYFLNAKTFHANQASISFRGDIASTKIEAVCAYL